MCFLQTPTQHSFLDSSVNNLDTSAAPIVLILGMKPSRPTATSSLGETAPQENWQHTASSFFRSLLTLQHFIVKRSTTTSRGHVHTSTGVLPGLSHSSSSSMPSLSLIFAPSCLTSSTGPPSDRRHYISINVLHHYDLLHLLLISLFMWILPSLISSDLHPHHSFFVWPLPPLHSACA